MLGSGTQEAGQRGNDSSGERRRTLLKIVKAPKVGAVGEAPEEVP